MDELLFEITDGIGVITLNRPQARNALDNEAARGLADAFRAFEAWYETERGQPFLKAYERYVPPTPVVEF